MENAWSQARFMKSPMWNKLVCSAHGLTCALGEKSSPPQEELRIYEEFDLCRFLRKEFVSPVQEFQCCHWSLDLTQGGKWGTALQEQHEPCYVVWATIPGISGNIWETPSLVSGGFLV